MNILLWHVHGSWTTAFVQGNHQYFVPVLPDRGPDGLGRARTWEWPTSVHELTPPELREHDFDVIILQRPHEIDLARRWLAREPGKEVPAVYLEHNTPGSNTCHQRHPMSDRTDIPVVHVTHFNELFWDNGSAPTVVIEHGIIDPGMQYSGELECGAVVVNEASRRGRTVGSDLVPGFTTVGPIDVFGMKAAEYARSAERKAGSSIGITGYQDLLTQADMHRELARRRVYVHPMRWTSLGLSLLEAMHLGMPVLVLATTEANRAVPPSAGVVSTSLKELHDGFRLFLHEPDVAMEAGSRARAAALDRYGLNRFLHDWDQLLEQLHSGGAR